MEKKYKYKNKLYRIIGSSRVKIDGAWQKCVIYEALYDNPDGQVWVRLADEFFNKFMLTEIDYDNNN